MIIVRQILGFCSFNWILLNSLIIVIEEKVKGKVNQLGVRNEKDYSGSYKFKDKYYKTQLE